MTCACRVAGWLEAKEPKKDRTRRRLPNVRQGLRAGPASRNDGPSRASRHHVGAVEPASTL